MTVRRTARLAAGCLLAAACGVAAVASPVMAQMSFKGKTVNIIVNSNPGGGPDGPAGWHMT